MIGTGSIITIALRLLVPPVILWHPLVGLGASIALDTFDVGVAAALGDTFGEIGATTAYQYVDKLLDTYYLAFVYAVMLRSNDVQARRFAIVLFWHRLVGTALFLVTGWRPWLAIFPNIFEYFVLFYLLALRFFPRLRPHNTWHLVLIVLAVGMPSTFREILYHYLGMSVVDALNWFTPLDIQEPSLWEWLKGKF